MRLDIIIGEVCLYLNSSETFLTITTLNKDLSALLNKNEYKSYWIRNHFGISLQLEYRITEKLFLSNKKNKILNFSPWKTDAGISIYEIENNFSNMWEYNCNSYSTFYASPSDLPLNANANCLAYFAGGKQTKKHFLDAFNNDYYSYSHGYTPPSYFITNYNQQECLLLNPLGKEKYASIDHIPQQPMPFIFRDKPKRVSFPMDISAELPIITKVALARPFFYTGAVKTLLIIMCDEYFEAEYSGFNAYDNITTVELAESLGKVLSKNVESNDVKYIEYEKGTGYYPLLWVQFQRCGFNHAEIQLRKAHFGRTCCVKFIDIDDRRDVYALSDAQPNYDFTYALFIGDILLN